MGKVIVDGRLPSKIAFRFIVANTQSKARYVRHKAGDVIAGNITVGDTYGAGA
jgi:hypothetical protein